MTEKEEPEFEDLTTKEAVFFFLWFLIPLGLMIYLVETYNIQTARYAGVGDITVITAEGYMLTMVIFGGWILFSFILMVCIRFIGEKRRND